MNKNRLAVVTLCVLAAAGLTAGCGTTKDSAGGSPTTATTTAAATTPSAPDPKAALLASTKALDEATFEFQVKEAEQTAKGKMDPVKKGAAVNLSAKQEGVTLTMDVTVIGTDIYMRLDLGTVLNKQLGVNKAKWMVIDGTKVTKKGALPTDTSGSEIANDLLGGLVTVERVDETHFKGTVDLTKMANFGPDETVLTKVGDKAKAVPFTATLDTKGRLTEIKSDGTGIDPALTVDMTFSNFGGAVSITKPAGATPAPASVYSMLNG